MLRKLLAAAAVAACIGAMPVHAQAPAPTQTPTSQPSTPPAPIKEKGQIPAVKSDGGAVEAPAKRTSRHVRHWRGHHYGYWHHPHDDWGWGWHPWHPWHHW